MKITADTNVLVRALVQDDPEQSRAACTVLEKAELIAIPLPVLCELVWVLRRVYRTAEPCCGKAAIIPGGIIHSAIGVGPFLVTTRSRLF